MQKPGLDKSVSEFFSKGEISSSEIFYRFIDKKKILVFVPPDHVEKLITEMSRAGAGLIGNFEMCSFRTEGIGTFKPNRKAKPFTGKKNQLSYEKEFELEMECSPENLNRVIDSLLKNHPYEETAYEIYDFRRREKDPAGVAVTLKTKQPFTKLLKKLNPGIYETEDINGGFRKIAITNSKIDRCITDSARMISCDGILYISNNIYKFIQL